MSDFTRNEIEYLESGLLGRLATIGRDGTPHVAPVGFRYNAELDAIDVGGHGMTSTKKFRDVARSGRAALVADDLASTDPWRPRGIEVRGSAEAVEEPRPLIRIRPERIVAWGIDTDEFRRNSRPAGEAGMNEEPLTLVEREVLGWPGVWKKRDEDGPGGVGVTGYRLGRRRIGHVHDDGHADFSFPSEVRDELIRSGRATLHPAFPDSRTTASYRIDGPEAVPGAVDLFRLSYRRVAESSERRAARS